MAVDSICIISFAVLPCLVEQRQSILRRHVGLDVVIRTTDVTAAFGESINATAYLLADLPGLNERKALCVHAAKEGQVFAELPLQLARGDRQRVQLHRLPNVET